jgi:pre-mRNA-processing factor 40
MNGQPALWAEARAADGRVYYYNTQTKATQWTKPVELMAPAEVTCATLPKCIYQANNQTSQKAITSSPWKEYAHEGRKYWHNTETNVTTWEMPDILKGAQAAAPATPVLPAKPAAP